MGEWAKWADVSRFNLDWNKAQLRKETHPVVKKIWEKAIRQCELYIQKYALLETFPYGLDSMAKAENDRIDAVLEELRRP